MQEAPVKALEIAVIRLGKDNDDGSTFLDRELEMSIQIVDSPGDVDTGPACRDGPGGVEEPRAVDS